MFISKVSSSGVKNDNQVIYALQFTGQAVPQNDQGTVLKATTKSPSSKIRTVVSRQGVKSKIKTVKGKVAKFVYTVEFLTPETFLENGKIEFGSGNPLTF
ncbi:hypothetical protein BJP36_04275 [Moorena producens JHB]|uniref:Uncharacterized protein n=1 Tax=Moorena producens (strain JHB) TaxID=1454205 RepID=A0A1D9FV42_MOOP1|nr:hypothetical protein [Moorena producens]AOY79249.2 hypothetical protein BJP36_04275 [Moorena producens JHB]